jgi:hypothetical protein
MTFSQAVRYMMDQCDVHGLHHEVLTDFMHQFDQVFNENERLCRAGKPQVAPNFAVMADHALREWDI